jgi:hypothetical protein
MIGSIVPGSIRTLDDVTNVIELLIQDVLRDICASQGRSRNALYYLIEDHDLDFAVAVEDGDVYRARDAELDRLRAENARLIAACKQLKYQLDGVA